MPLAYRIDAKHRVVVATGSGVLTIDDLFAYQREAWLDRKVCGYNELVDMRDVDRIDPPSAAHLRDFSDFAASMDEAVGESKLAVVAKGDLDFGLARMFQSYRELNPNSKKRIQVFRSLRDALAYLGLSEADLSPE